MSLARTLILIGGALVALVLLLQLAPHIPVLGKLPGDMQIERDGASFHFPLTTAVLLSAIVTLVMQLIERRK